MLDNKEIKVKSCRIEVPNLPCLPLRSIFVASSGQGKTNSIHNFTNFYKEYIDDIYIICPTQDLKLKMLTSSDKYFEDASFESVNIIIETIKQNIEEYKQYLEDLEFYKKVKNKNVNLLDMEDLSKIDDMLNAQNFPPTCRYKRMVSSWIIIDDSIGTELFGNNKRNPLINFYIRSRHYNTSIVLSTQYWYSLNKSLRANSTVICIFQNRDIKQLKEIYKEISSVISFEKFMEFFDKATSEKYNFLMIDVDKGEFKKNFNLNLS